MGGLQTSFSTLQLEVPSGRMQPPLWIAKLELQQPFRKYTAVQHVQNDLCAVFAAALFIIANYCN